ncbi:hypothetical protein BDW62DRAFT_203392 [Aspergillus aurantiobrunneus]
MPSRRSRFGCRNCKLRKLKCDEAKPQCKRCRAFGVVCNFMSTIPDLQPIAADVVRGNAAVQRPLATAVWTADASTSYQLNTRCQDFITRYLGRSLITPDDPNLRQVNRKLLDLAFAYPCLMHASLAVALTYDRHLNGPSTPRTVEECLHWSQSTSLLNKRLAQPIQPEDRDPIWGTTAALVILTFSSPDASTPEQSWPLNRSSPPSTLDWLRMSKGKMSLWHILNPLRPDSLFRVMAGTFADMLSPLPESGIDGIPASLATICNLTASSTAQTNPYFHAAHAVSRVQSLPDSQVNTGQAQLFMRSIDGAFGDLLSRRDPVALLLLYLWYGKAGRCIWWVGLRARVEGPSIWRYLRLYHGEDEAVLGFLG